MIHVIQGLSLNKPHNVCRVLCDESQVGNAELLLSCSEPGLLEESTPGLISDSALIQGLLQIGGELRDFSTFGIKKQIYLHSHLSV